MSTFDRLVDAGKSFACSLYRNQPGALIPNPINDVLRLVWDDLCGDDSDGLPPPPTPPFQGGQCDAVVYRVFYTILSSDGNSDSFGDFYGPITGARVTFDNPEGPRSRARYFIGCRGGSDSPTGPTPPQFVFVGTNPNMPLDTSMQITNIERRDGQPDSCGNPPATYPLAPPPPPGGYNSPPTSITYNDGDDFTAIFNLKPPTNDNPPPPDICLSVIVSGVEVKLCFPFGLPPSFGGDDSGDIGDILTDIQNNINNLQEDVDNLQDDFDKFTDPPPPESDPDLNETDSPDDEGGEQDDLPGLKWVLVRLTTLPVKSQFGTPSVNFAGWITFKIGGDYTDRIPIAFENGVFQAPPGATGYAITFTNMAKGISKAYTQDITP